MNLAFASDIPNLWEKLALSGPAIAFIAVILFLISMASLFIFLFTGFSVALWGSVFVIFCPLAFFINQIKSQGLKEVPMESLFFSLVLSFVYYLGRAGGFVNSIFRER